ncbi:MAG: putative Fe-S protein YdhL (DUF1289 family) [Motiliproteus sp.]
MPTKVPTIVPTIVPTKAPTIASPCIRNCCLDDQDICIGCSRTLDEILHWGAADHRRKSQILEAISERNLERKSARLNRLEGQSTVQLTSKQEGLDAGKDDLGSHRGQDQAGDLAEDI